MQAIPGTLWQIRERASPASAGTLPNRQRPTARSRGFITANHSGGTKASGSIPE